MTNQQEMWNSQQRTLGQPFNRQHPPVLPPPATLETGGQSFYPLPSLPSLGNGAGHPQSGHVFNIPSINTGGENIAVKQPSNEIPIQNTEIRRRSETNSNNTSTQLPLPSSVPSAGEPQNVSSQTSMGQGIPNRLASTNVYRPLNVKDALSYLDQVKIQFYNQADVYNNFLDIMKDFKSQSIDTPGVIDRVSTLFRGHPNLIQGFNTFLPPGYRIECSWDPSDPNPIRVTTPTGTTTKPNINGNYSSNWDSTASQEQEIASRMQQQQVFHQSPVGGQFPAEQLQQQDQNPGSQIEFNHAISYVNKIKTRFANQPDIYKQFLEILQTYQREQKPIGEVYEQVTVLFANSPDLLDDFKQFLPDTSNQGYAQGAEQQLQAGGYYGNINEASQLPPVGNFQQHSAVTGINANGANQFQQGGQFSTVAVLNGAEALEAEAEVNRKKKSISEAYGYDNEYKQDPQYSNMRISVQGVKGGKYGASDIKNGSAVTVTNPTLVPGIPEPVPLSATAKSSSLSEELNFFDKVKKAIGNKQTYNEFLKILNLFSQDIIDKETLVERVEGFLGDNYPELINWFKMFVGYEDKPQHIENIVFKKHQLELSLCKSYGPSYRQLPKAETYMPCSGRDEMCWEVLNDEWVGHPTWASEDSGFIAHRKNQYEEILFKIEEERLEFDYYMESNLRTIQKLETIANRIANMTPEQKANFKLPPGLGHTSQTIYKKVIRKIYDKDRGFEVIDALHENPAVAVPVVLKRLKQKDEEWKRSQREWNKVWREMEQKVFYKSLDHLGLTFKQADKKLLTAKQLVSEISTVKVEQQNKRLHPLTPKPQEQLNYQFVDYSILMDIYRLSDCFINKSSNYSANDREKLGQFFQFFLGLFFDIPEEDFDKFLANKSDDEKVEGTQEQESKETTLNSESTQSKKRHRENDLLKDVLKKQSKSKKDDRAESPNNALSEAEENELAEEIEKSSELWIKVNNTEKDIAAEASSQQRRHKYNLFCNTVTYVLFRHLRTLYERLEEIKKMNEEVGKEIRSRKNTQFAVDLNLLPHQLEDMGIELSGDKDCYLQVLDLSEKLIEGELEHQWFEESLRQAYRNKAYKIYSIDKVVQAMVKHMHTMITDSKTSEIIVLFEQDRKKPFSSAKEQILYRMQVRSCMSTDENMFKITYNDIDHSVNIQFVALDDLTINDHESAEARYNYYVTSYIMSHPTEGVSASKLNMPFSKSFIENIEEDQCEGRTSSELKVSICQNSYRLFFEADGHDEFTSNSVFTKENDDSENKKEKVETLRKLIDGEDYGWRSTLKSDQDPEIQEQNLKVLFERGADDYRKIVNETNATKEAQKEQETEDKSETSLRTDDAQKFQLKPNAENVHDADATVQENNDTTIQQDVNDTTHEDTTVNQEEASMIVDG